MEKAARKRKRTDFTSVFFQVEGELPIRVETQNTLAREGSLRLR